MGTLQEVFCQALEQLGTEWSVFPVSHVRNEGGRLGLLISTNKLVANGGIDAASLQRCAPSFCSLYSQVMLRDIQELIESGDDE